jgi:anthranilate phosphoribosyltransferase
MSKGKLSELIEKLINRGDLSPEEGRSAANLLASAEVAPEEKKQFLISLTEKGETPGEISIFAATFRELATDPGIQEFQEKAIDVCGTGGDKSGSFNLSTTTAFVLAAAGVPVFKHGNRSLTSKCGSADLLERLGIPLTPSMDQHAAALKALNFTFLFAPAHHPAFKEIMPVRQELGAAGKRTIFNLLGPLINPGKPAFQLLGVYSQELLEPLAEALHALGLRRGLIVHTSLGDGKGMDELATCGTCHVTGFGEFKTIRESWTPEQLGLTRCELKDVQGGDLDYNEKILHQILGNEAPTPLLESLCLNAGAGLWIAGKVSDLQEGIRTARDLLSSGKVKTWLDKAQTFYKPA